GPTRPEIRVRVQTGARDRHVVQKNPAVSVHVVAHEPGATAFEFVLQRLKKLPLAEGVSQNRVVIVDGHEHPDLRLGQLQDGLGFLARPLTIAERPARWWRDLANNFGGLWVRGGAGEFDPFTAVKGGGELVP